MPSARAATDRDLVKPKMRGRGIEVRTFVGHSGQSYLVFRTGKGSFHTFLEVEAKQAAHDCGAPRQGSTRQLWQQLWRRPSGAS